MGAPAGDFGLCTAKTPRPCRTSISAALQDFYKKAFDWHVDTDSQAALDKVVSLGR